VVFVLFCLADITELRFATRLRQRVRLLDVATLDLLSDTLIYSCTPALPLRVRRFALQFLALCGFCALLQRRCHMPDGA